MAALFREKTANYVVNEHVEVDTEDHEDHTFSGVMFTIEAISELPVDFVQVDSISVRGALGPLTVWATEGSWEGKHRTESAWVKVYEKNHEPSWRTFVELKFSEKVLIPRGESVGMYVHSKRRGDEAIVYDNQRAKFTHTDQFIKVGPGLAHLSNVPFSDSHSWGAWRERRQFVGRVSYGAKFELWNPQTDVHSKFPPAFKELAKLFLLIKPQDNCPLSWMSNDILFYILNMCRWDWVKASPELQSELDARAVAEKAQRVRAARKARQEQKLLRLRFLEQRAGLTRAMARELRALERAESEGTLDSKLRYSDDEKEDDEEDEEGGGGGGGGRRRRPVTRSMMDDDDEEEEEDDEDEEDEDEDLSEFQAMMRWVIMSSSPAAAATRMRLAHRQNLTGLGGDDDEEEEEEEEEDDPDWQEDEDEEESETHGRSGYSIMMSPFADESDEDGNGGSGGGGGGAAASNDDDSDNESGVSGPQTAGRMAWMLPSAVASQGGGGGGGGGGAGGAGAAAEDDGEDGDDADNCNDREVQASHHGGKPSAEPLLTPGSSCSSSTALSTTDDTESAASSPPEPPAKAYRRLYRGGDTDMR